MEMYFFCCCSCILKEEKKDNKQTEVTSGRDSPWTPYTLYTDSPVCIFVSFCLCFSYLRCLSVALAPEGGGNEMKE